MVFTQIVPKLPPAINGLGDYALNLARQLKQDWRIDTQFIVGDPTWTGEPKLEGFPIYQLNDRSARNLEVTLSDSSLNTVLLHYVGYGYAKRGCPIWLIDGLQRWQMHGNHRHIITMFHEIYAPSHNLWTSSFWLTPLQKQLASKLIQLSKYCFTSRQGYANLICRLYPVTKSNISVLPVFSNIGEAKSTSQLAQRNRRLVIFGSHSSRSQAYLKYYQALNFACKALAIEEIYDIGIPTGIKSRITDIPVVEKGVIEASEISQILQDSLAGFVSFPPPDYLAKSTIFAAFCAHRLLPILPSASTMPMDNLEAGKHYWVASDSIEKLSLDRAQAIADEAYTWYSAHSLPTQAKIFASYLTQSGQ